MKKIIYSAVKINEDIYVGERHCEIYKCLVDNEIIKTSEEGIDGFTDNIGMFYTREEAYILVKRNGQLCGDIIGGELTSEDLW